MTREQFKSTVSAAWKCASVALVLFVASAGSALAAETVTYFHTDGLGTPVLESNASGQVAYASDVRPYGAKAMGAEKQGPGFTGHVADVDTGLAYMQQRYYDPVMGRFLSSDPMAANADTGDHFNRYAYAANNPLKFVDLDGRVPLSPAVQNMRDTADHFSISGKSFLSPIDLGQVLHNTQEHVLPDAVKTAERISNGEKVPAKDEDGDGDHHCAELVKSNDTLGAPHTSTWSEGRRIKPGMDLKPGTAIATFKDGRYPGESDDVKHVAIFIGFAPDGSGILVLDQWNARPNINYREITWALTGYDEHTNYVNSASNFSTIEW